MKKVTHTVRIQWSRDDENGFREIYCHSADEAIRTYSRMVDEQIHGEWANAFERPGVLKKNYIVDEHTPDVETANFYIAQRDNPQRHTVILVSKFRKEGGVIG